MPSMPARIVFKPSAVLSCTVALFCIVPSTGMAQAKGIPVTTGQIFPGDPAASVPTLTSVMKTSTSELADIINRFSADQSGLQRRYDTPNSASRQQRLKGFYTEWRSRLAALDFNKLSQEGRVDYVLLDNHLRYQLELMQREEKQLAETGGLIPFANELRALQETRRDLVSIDGQKSAALLARITKQVDSLRTALEASGSRGGGGAGAAGAGAGAAAGGAQAATQTASAAKVSRTVANRAADQVDQIRSVVTNWYRYYNGYDPLFSWWAGYQSMAAA